MNEAIRVLSLGVYCVGLVVCLCGGAYLAAIISDWTIDRVARAFGLQKVIREFMFRGEWRSAKGRRKIAKADGPAEGGA